MYRDFDSMPGLIGALDAAGLSVDTSAVLCPDPQAPSIILSQSIELSDSELGSLGLK